MRTMMQRIERMRVRFGGYKMMARIRMGIGDKYVNGYI